MVNEGNGAGLLRMVGVMSIFVGIVWVLQILAFSGAGGALSRLTWIVGAAAISGAGVGLIFAASNLLSARSAEA